MKIKLLFIAFSLSLGIVSAQTKMCNVYHCVTNDLKSDTLVPLKIVLKINARSIYVYDTIESNKELTRKYNLPEYSYNIAFQVIDPFDGTIIYSAVNQTNYYRPCFFGGTHKLPHFYGPATADTFSLSNGQQIVFSGNMLLGEMAVSELKTWTRNIQIFGGHSSDRFSIYCEPNAIQEPKLQLVAPCIYKAQQPTKHVYWFESETPNGPWKVVAAGDSIYPAVVSYQKGKNMFNKVRYYMCKVGGLYFTDSCEGMCESTILGPVTFYLPPPQIDSVVFKNPLECNIHKDVTYYFKQDSNYIPSKAPMLFGYFTPKDSTKVQRLFMGTLEKSGTGLWGRKVVNYNDPFKSTWSGQWYSDTTMRFRPGKYIFYTDFTPWNQLDCNLRYDTFFVNDASYDFIGIKEQKINPSCTYDLDGLIIWKIAGGDSAGTYVISKDNGPFTSVGTPFLGLKTGIYSYLIQNGFGCIAEFKDTMMGFPEFENKVHIDTTLCNGQYVFVDAHHPEANAFEVTSNIAFNTNKDTFTLDKAGIYFLKTTDKNNCNSFDTILIKKIDLDVVFDFLVPTEAFVTDTLFAVNITRPYPDTSIWRLDRQSAFQFLSDKHTLGLFFKDTGKYLLTLNSRFQECGFSLTKPVIIHGGSDSSKINSKYGYQGPLIQGFEVSPNPHDGINFKIKVTLRDASDFSVYKIDPGTGDIVGELDIKNKKIHEFTAFTSNGSEIYFLKLKVGKESKTIKVIAVQ